MTLTQTLVWSIIDASHIVLRLLLYLYWIVDHAAGSELPALEFLRSTLGENHGVSNTYSWS